MSEPPKATGLTLEEIRAERKRLETERTRLARQALTERAARSFGLPVAQYQALSEEDLVALVVARAKTVQIVDVPPPRTDPGPVGPTLPPAARVALGTARVKRPLLQAADVGKFRKGDRPNAKVWLPAMRKHAATRQPGDVMQPTLERVAEYVFGLCSNGIAQIPFDGIAAGVGVCRETARQAINWWTEGSDLLDCGNVMGWYEKVVQGARRVLQLRDANVYRPRLPDALDEAAAPAELEDAAAFALRQLRRFTRQLERWAKASGLFVRPQGLNTTPLASRRLYREAAGNPAPT